MILILDVRRPDFLDSRVSLIFLLLFAFVYVNSFIFYILLIIIS